MKLWLPWLLAFSCQTNTHAENIDTCEAACRRGNRSMNQYSARFGCICSEEPSPSRYRPRQEESPAMPASAKTPDPEPAPQ